MLEYNAIPKIVINLPAGLYFFDFESATGKTYLYSLLSERMDAGDKVITYTYSDFVRGFSLLHLVKTKSCKLLMVDRFDMFKDSEDALAAIRLAARSRVVLVSIHTMNVKLGNARIVDISFTPEHIEVIP